MSVNPVSLSRLRATELSFQSACKVAEEKYVCSLLDEFTTSNHSIYRYIGLLRKGAYIPSTVYRGSSYASDDVDRGNLFNEYFHSVFTQSSYSLPPDDEILMPARSLGSIEITASDVFDVLSTLDPSKAMGTDGIGPRIIRECALALCEQLQRLFSVILCQHLLPAEWKIHCISPIHKSGDRASVENYRPISLLSSTSKILERLIYNKCIDLLSPTFYVVGRHCSRCFCSLTIS